MAVGECLACRLTEQLADKPTRGQSTHGLDNSRTSQLADDEFKKIMELLCFICMLKPNHNPNSNPFEYRQRINSVICQK